MSSRIGETMSEAEFMDLVAEMRMAQRDYFRCRTSSLLKICKELEKKVDAEINRIKNGITLTQASLLNGYGQNN